ncbi:Zinc carboxypeptidase [Lutibacter oricola]|uniref:Zinc carboxypeptidase n=1 Tax=Lutibacter oricola TaxID=762486 RepID=A0A1H2XCZ8_9FLAO|nr:M14 family zinc carboxypeptidase [Lutibacter oricola]SDW90730.1 Zinc carboxypeptidase [Lutibacter oricola]
MKTGKVEDLQHWYKNNFESSLVGRRILFTDIEPLLINLPSKFTKEIIGTSESGIPIYKVSIGTGKKKILLWSQMHGNESTGTKAMFDLFNYLNNESFSSAILKECTLQFIPLLNPDGAIKFTRENLNDIDLNRDAVAIKATESKLLRSILDEFNPKFCFNLHDQRSIFNVEGTQNTATISFLAPSIDEERTLTEERKETMSVIVAMNSFLQQLIPNHIGRYTDEFYPTATGDNFQKLGHNTILIEAGHYKNDYERETTREFNFYALVEGLNFITNTTNYSNYEEYFNIPNNDKLFLDIIYKNLTIELDGVRKITDVGIQFKFKVLNNKLVKYKCIEQIGDLSKFASNNIINAENLNYLDLELSNS